MIDRISRAVDDTVTELVGAAARLTESAHHVTEIVSEPSATPDALRTKALAVQAALQRASLAVQSAASHSGQLLAYAHARRIEHAERERRIHGVRVWVEAEAMHDARLYLDDRRSDPDGCPPLEEWAAGAFDDTWDSESPTIVGDVARETAREWYLATFRASVDLGGEQ